MNIISPEFSFLDFDYFEYSDACDSEALNALPMCDLGIKGQIEIETDEDLLTTTPIYIAIADSDCNVIYDADLTITPICSLYKFLTTFEEFVIGEDNEYNLCNTTNDTPIVTQDFTTNPFDLITSADLVFKTEDIGFAKEIQLYIETNVYLIRYGITTETDYNYYQIDNVYFVTINSESLLLSRINLRRFLIDVVDANHGTTTSLASITFTIANMPADSYLNNNNFATDITTVTASTNIAKWFYWNSKLNYSFTNQVASDEPIFTFESALTDTQWYEFKINYSAIYTDITGTVTFDNGIDAPTSVNIAFNEFSGVLNVPYLATQTATHTITIELTDVNGHINGLSFNSINEYETVVFDVTDNISGNVPIGVYTKSELIALISEILGFDFDCEFTSCCEVNDIEFEVTLDNDDTTYLYKLTPYWRKGFINFPELPLETIIPECFTYAILDSNKDLVACSNLFEKVEDCCFVTKIEYSNNEDAFGFTYPTGVTNSVNFPFFLHSPQYPTTEKIYKQTNGQYRRLSADIEKEYECETDYIQESYHDKLITALKHDTLIVTSNRLGFTAQMSQNGDYSPDWNSKIEFTSKAEFKLKKYFNGKNSNCGANC